MKLTKDGRRDARAKLTPAQVDWIRNEGKGVSAVEIARALGVCGETVRRIRRGENWSERASVGGIEVFGSGLAPVDSQEIARSIERMKARIGRDTEEG